MYILPGYSIWQVLLMLGYLAILAYTLLCVSNPFTNPKRSGWIATSQLPFLFVFAVKNNILGWLLGIGYQSLHYIHRYLGQLVILAANVHTFCYLYDYSLRRTISIQLKRESNVFGMVALICFDIIFSTSLWRNKIYNMFKFTHMVGSVVAIPAIYFHHSSTLPFIIIASVIYCLNLVLRLLKTRIVNATIHPLPALSATRIEIPKFKFEWRAGQHVRVRILSAQLGRFGWAESHPFTIAGAPEAGVGGEEGLTLICKKTGKWTARLFEMSKEDGYLESGVAQDVNIGRSVKVMIEGPYGGPGYAIFTSYSAVVMVVGGSGVTFATSTVQSLVQDGLKGESRVKVIELVWMIQDRGAAAPLVPLFRTLTEACSYLSITIFCTRDPGKSNHLSSERLRMNFHAGRPGRAGLVQIMENAIARSLNGSDDVAGNGSTVSAEHDIHGMMVGICGPVGLSKEVRGAVDSICAEKQTEVGGVEIHEEVFGW